MKHHLDLFGIQVSIICQQIQQQYYAFFRNKDNNIPYQLKTKHITLKGIDFKIIDVPHHILTTLKKCYNISSSFKMEKASTFIQMVLCYGILPDDLQNRLVIAACDWKTDSSITYLQDSIKVLNNLFTNFSSYDLEEAFTNNKKFLLTTISFIKNDIKFKSKKLPFKRIPSKYIIILDPLVSVQLDEIFHETEKRRHEKFKDKYELIEIHKAKKDCSLVECTCCFCEYPIKWMLQCPEGHLMCKKCVKKHIETTISEGRSNVKCLKFGGDCDCDISIDELNRMIPKKIIKRLIQTDTLNAITSANIENTVKCHKCGFIVIVEDLNGPMNCPQCKAQTCVKCGAAFHKDLTCEQYKEIDKNRIIEEQMNEAVVRTCPNCKTQFMKEDGCNKMECPRCNTWICYWCRQEIPKNVGYEHFWRNNGPCPPDKCPLWVTNETLHFAEVEGAKNNFNEYFNN